MPRARWRCGGCYLAASASGDALRAAAARGGDGGAGADGADGADDADDPYALPALTPARALWGTQLIISHACTASGTFAQPVEATVLANFKSAPRLVSPLELFKRPGDLAAPTWRGWGCPGGPRAVQNRVQAFIP